MENETQTANIILSDPTLGEYTGKILKETMIWIGGPSLVVAGIIIIIINFIAGHLISNRPTMLYIIGLLMIITGIVLSITPTCRGRSLQKL